jgi:hypothetical protein
MKTNTIFTIISTILVVIVIAIMGYVIKTQHDIISSIDHTNKEQKFLKDNITRIESTILTPEDFDDKLKILNMDLSIVRRDLDSVGGKLDQIIISSNKTPGGSYNGLPSTGTTPIDNNTNTNPDCPGCVVDRYGYFSNVQQLDLNEPLSNGDKVPWGSVEFNATKENPWGYNVLPRTYSSEVVLATDASGKKRAYNKMSISVDGKTYDMPKTEVKYYERYPEPQFFLWNPRAMVGFDVGYSTHKKATVMPSAQLFISSYGKTKRNTDFYIGGVGVGYDIETNNYNMVVTPFSYKITPDSSVFQNINVGPSVGIDSGGDVYGVVGLRFGL